MTGDQAGWRPVPVVGVSDAAPRHAAVRAWERWVDRFAGSDPGLNRFRMALQSVLTIAVILAAEGSSCTSRMPCSAGSAWLTAAASR